MLKPNVPLTALRCESGACVEVTLLPDGRIRVRDTKNLSGPALYFTQREWVAFTGGVRDGDFALPPTA